MQIGIVELQALQFDRLGQLRQAFRLFPDSGPLGGSVLSISLRKCGFSGRDRLPLRRLFDDGPLDFIRQ